MRDYAKVSPKFWIGQTGKALRSAGMEAQIVAMYLLSSPHANMLGLYYCPIEFIAHETGLTLEGASKGLQRAIEAGFCLYDQKTEIVWVMEMAKYQIGEALKPNDLRVKGVQNEYAALPQNPFLSMFYDKYHKAFHMEVCREPFSTEDRPFEAPLKALRSQEQEQEQKQKHKNCEMEGVEGEPEPSPPNPPEGGTGQGEVELDGGGAKAASKASKAGITLRTWLAQVRESGEPAIRDDDPVFDYADQAGIPIDFLRLQWLEFKARYQESDKRYKDWKAVFRKSVRGNWFNLWVIRPGQDAVLTTVGVQAQRIHQDALKEPA